MTADRVAALTFREGEHSDLRAAFTLAELTVHDTARRMGVLSTAPPSEEQIEHDWHKRRDLLQFTASQDGGGFWVCEDEGRPVGYGRVCQFGAMEELTELMVLPEYHRNGIGRALLQRLWPADPTPDLGRVVVAAGTPADLTLYADFGVMPVTGHWHMRASAEDFRERRAQEIDSTDPPAHVLSPERAATEWKRLEPPAIGHRRPMLHDFFGRTRICLATMDASATRATALCWVDSSGQVGPAVAATSQDLVPVVLQALDRVAMTRHHDTLAIFCSTDSWWLLRRLRQLCFRVWWPSWVMCSIPLPGLDRYVPTRPPHLL
ncbi:MAG TPA: GNAT family N-acetyltransferase [Thermoleophilaceae bacterium]|nr:GNAT family N-acetyltransferase [Thermoleophilaceae bacterium]